jgi:hypothetical protein
VVDRSKKYIDQRAMDAIGRMGGDGYALTRDYFDLPTPSLAQWERREVPRRKPRDADNEIATENLADRPTVKEAGEPGSAAMSGIGITSHQE